MRRFLLPLLLFITLSGAVVACNRGEPQLALETLRLDLGDVPNGEVAARDVFVRNDGHAVLVVDGVTTSCGCTTATLDLMQFAPGESGMLHIEFDSGAHGPELTGPLVRQLFINSNDPAQPEVIVELTANVTPPLSTGSN